LITAKSEPFGLTIPECIEKGIPVIASSCGGPEELLPEEWLYPVDNLAACVQAIERFLVDLKASEKLFNSCSTHLKTKLNQQNQIKSLSLWLAKILESPLHQDDPDSNIDKLWKLSQFDASYRFSPTDLAPLVRQASNLDDAQWDSLIGAEQKRAGSAVAIEMAHYGLSAHASSQGLSALYKDGNSFLIELLIGHGKGGRAEMSAFVMASLLDRLQPEASKILAFGDGLGIDSLQLLNAGYEVDYVDISGSRTACAAKIIINTYASIENIDRIHFLSQLPIEPLYDAIVCLEVVEHVEEPFVFLQSLCQTLKYGGFLVISECFAGVEPQWQTHLHTNLKYGGHLPGMLAQLGLELVDANLNPAAKPLVFRRCLQGELPSWSWSWDGLAA
jgi:2-polyprenyl-3-methyl-5-hydroxy-6-metoxy-1,4-benzoquinol methylase